MTADRMPDNESAAPSLSPEQFQRLASYGTREDVVAGDVLYATGDRRYDLFLIESAAIVSDQVLRRAAPHDVAESIGLAYDVSAYLARRLEAHPSVRVWTRTQVAGLNGGGELDGIVLRTAGGPDREVRAGDVRAGSVKRVASAVGEGAGAVASVHLMLAQVHDSGS